MRFSSFIFSAFCLKDIVTYIEGKSSHRDYSSLLLAYYISYSILLLTKDINYENTRPTDFCILRKNINIATYCSTQSSPAESLTLTLATERQNILYRRTGPTKLLTHYIFLPCTMQTSIFWNIATIICFCLFSNDKDTGLNDILQKWVLEFH